MNVAQQEIRPNDEAFDHWLAKLAPDVVLFDRFMTEEQFGWRVDRTCPKALRILNTSDLHCLREARRVQLEEGTELDVFNTIALREIAAIHRSDLSLLIADYEVELLRTTFGVPEKQIAYLPFWLERTAEASLPFESRQHFIFIGSFQHPPNVDAVRWLKRKIWPRIRAKLPQAELHCYGSYGDNYTTELHAPKDGFLYKGRAKDALLTLQNYRVNCVPLRYGAGLKGKVFDGFQAGTPTVATPIGAEGIANSEEWGCALSRDPETFASTAADLYLNEARWKKVQAQGKTIIQNKFSAKQWSTYLQQLIREASEHREENRKHHFVGRMLRHHHHRSTEYMSRWIEAKTRLNSDS